MKTFLCKGKKPIIKWTLLPDNTFFEGKLPEGYSLAVVPSGNYIVVDIDKHGSKNGFLAIPVHIYKELMESLNYPTKNNGKHVWLKYSGTEPLANKPSGKGIDLRIGDKGYVIWYHHKDIRECLSEIKETSPTMNEWLVELFGYVKNKKLKL